MNISKFKNGIKNYSFASYNELINSKIPEKEAKKIISISLLEQALYFLKHEKNFSKTELKLFLKPSYYILFLLSKVIEKEDKELADAIKKTINWLEAL